MTDAGHQGHLIGLETHPGAAPESEPASGQFPLNLVHRDGKARRQALHDHHQGFAMGLTGGQEPKHDINLLPGI